MEKIRNQKGFTLIELMVVLVIIGILATLAIPRFAGAQKKTKATECKPFLKEIYTLQVAYEVENAGYAAAAVNLGYTVSPPNSRFDYSHSNTTPANEVARATPNAKGIADISGIAATDYSCITEDAVIAGKTGFIQGLLNAGAGCN